MKKKKGEFKTDTCASCEDTLVNVYYRATDLPARRRRFNKNEYTATQQHILLSTNDFNNFSEIFILNTSSARQTFHQEGRPRCRCAVKQSQINISVQKNID